MSLVEVSRDKGNPPRYILKENESRALIEGIAYSEKKTYGGSYTLTCNFAGGNQRKLTFGSASSEFKFSENKTEMMVNAKGDVSFDIFFVPSTGGNKKFQLIIEGAISRQSPICILERKLNVRDGGPIGSPKLRGYIQNELPKVIPLGEKQKIIFIFENTGNQDATEVNIIIKSKLQN